jgi:glycosyltransferase involved in cell wall biosynthesis
LILGGGGHRNILRAAHFLQQFGHDVALYFTMDDGRDAEEFRSLVREHFYPFEGDVFVYDGFGRGDDVVFATHWTTVNPALAMQPVATKVMYFVQDFEPSFAPMSTEYVLAENTYRKGLYAITSGIWCERVLRRDFGMEADHFRFPVDRQIYYPRPEIRRENRIIFFAKPEMPRRCFELGVEALRILNRKRPEVEIVFFGSSKARGLVDFPVTFRDVLPGIGDLADLYASARLGVVFSTTNPSLVPYEMMACGLPVVDLARAGNEANYGDRLDIAFLANPEPEVMAEEIARLMADEGDLAARSRNGLAFVADFPTEMEMAKRVESLILARVKESADGGEGSGSDTPQPASSPKSTREAAANA